MFHVQHARAFHHVERSRRGETLSSLRSTVRDLPEWPQSQKNLHAGLAWHADVVSGGRRNSRSCRQSHRPDVLGPATASKVKTYETGRSCDENSLWWHVIYCHSISRVIVMLLIAASIPSWPLPPDPTISRNCTGQSLVTSIRAKKRLGSMSNIQTGTLSGRVGQRI